MTYSVPRRCCIDHGAGRRAAFTLTELLIVIVVVFVLAWILNPFHSHNPLKARQTACVSNMKVIGLAFAQYLSDYDGVYPNYDSFKKTITGAPPEPYANVNSEREWYTVLQPYLLPRENVNNLRCVSDTSLAPAVPINPDPD